MNTKDTNKEIIEKEWNTFWNLNRDRLYDDEDGLKDLDSSVNSKISFSVGFEKAFFLKEEDILKKMDEVLNDNKWLIFKEEKPNKKTKVFSVWSKCSGVCLGEIKWYSAWRHYCYIIDYDKTIATEEFIYSDRCLLQISYFVEKLNKEHEELKNSIKGEELCVKQEVSEQ